jgi:glycosyltransferase involved in cell wall biosynthesis
MKTCLFITTQFPYPLDNGGKIGAFNGLSVVSTNYKVTVLSFSEEMKYVREGMNFFKDVLPNVSFYNPIEHAIHIRKKMLALMKVMIKDFLFAKPYVTVKFDDSKMYRAIDEQFRKNSYFDLVFIDYLNMGIYLEYIQSRYKNNYGQIVLKDHNKEYEIINQEMEKNTGIKRFLLNRETNLTKKYEKNCIKSVNKAFSVCDDNTEFLKKNNIFSYTMLPTFTMLPNRKQVDNHNILYIGNLSWGANLDGLMWFLEEVMPLIVEKYPDAKVTVVGSGPNTENFKKYSYVDYRGYVKDISHIYEDQTIFIVPLFEGSGIRIKILEAFNNEIAVVSTTLGCGTIGARHQQEIMMADDVTTFSESIICLLDNPTMRLRMVENAKKMLEENYTLHVRAKEFIEIMEI